MDVRPPLAPSETNQVLRPLSPDVDAYLARLGLEQRRFLTAVGEANRDLNGTAGQLTKVVAIQTRLAQEFLDAQRAIIKRRAETDADIAEIAENADRDAGALLAAARSRACISIGRPLPAPAIGSWAAPMSMPLPASIVRPSIVEAPGGASESLARLIDGAFEPTEPDGVATRRQLRELLDAWWEAEKQEAKAAVDDAAARAAMRVHTAKVEASEIARFGPPSTSPNAPAVYRYVAPTALSTPMVTALDEADHEHLDDILAHLLDELDDRPSPQMGPAPAGSDATGTELDDPLALWALPANATNGAVPVLAPSADSLNDRTTAPQEAFDRFWGGFRGAGKQRWLFSQLILPAVSVIAVLALVLAVIG